MMLVVEASYILDGFIKTPSDLEGKKIRVIEAINAVNMVNGPRGLRLRSQWHYWESFILL